METSTGIIDTDLNGCMVEDSKNSRLKEGRGENVGCSFHLLTWGGKLISVMTITERRTKPLRGRKKDWCEAPFFY
jgi:hypothetical protein